MSKIKKIVLTAILIAISIILNRFISIKTELLVISFTFVPIMMSAIWLGTKYSIIIASLSDLIGALLFPFGPYFPGFTLNAAISGLIYGLLLYNKGNEMTNKKLIIMLTISSVLQLFLVNVFLTPLWLKILYGKAYWAVLTSRIVAQIIMFPIHIITIYGLEKFSRPFMKKYLFGEES